MVIFAQQNLLIDPPFTRVDLISPAYVEALSGLPRLIGRLLALKRHADVAVDAAGRVVGLDATVRLALHEGPAPA